MEGTKYGEDSMHEVSKTMDVEKKLTSHVPDLVVFDQNLCSVPHILKFDGVLLFADVSGFTALTERYTMSSEKGTDALTVTLNHYIGKIVQKILQSGGDILKFAGDAILAVWKVKSRADLTHAISQAAKCSLAIQEKCDNQETDVGVKLRVKIAISAGKIFATFVGNEESRHFVMAGRPVREVNAAEKYCEAGLVVLSPNAMELSDKENIITDPLSERFGLVKYLRRDLRKEWQDYIDVPNNLKLAKSAEVSARIALRIRPDPLRERVTRKFVTPVVQRKLDDDQPLKFLSEMRQCSIVFLNLAFELNERNRLYHEKQCENMQASFCAVFNTVKDRQGSLNKIFMFDKGCTFLIIFGLPGDKHEQEPAHALQAAWKISQVLRENLSSLCLVSAGVTTGPVFCGVIGHKERHEYTVIGQKVNLAARLMMHYPNVVSCDLETYKDSKLSSDMFTKLPHKAMKGVGTVIVYDYTEGDRKPVGTTTVTEPEYPIIGREHEIDIFVEELRELKVSQWLGQERRVIVFEGEAGYGKTRVMQEIQWRAACEGVRVIAFTLSINDQNTPFFAIKTLLDLLLGVEGCNERKLKEQSLLGIFDTETTDTLCLLNDILLTKFPLSPKVIQMEPETQTKALHKIMVKIVEKVTEQQFVLFALDDAQNVDNESWGFITTLSKHFKSLCVIALRPFGPDKLPCAAARQVLYHPKTMYMKLVGLLNEHLTPLACQFLRVERIPVQLEQLLIERSHGVPLWCEQLIREMQNAGILLVIPITSRSILGISQNSLVVTKEHSRHEPSVGVGERYLITPRTDSKKLNTVSEKLVDAETSEVEKKESGHIGSSNTEQREQKQTLSRKTDKNIDDRDLPFQKPRLPSWTTRIRRHKTSTIDMFEETPSQEKMSLNCLKSATSQYVAMECITKPNFNLRQFPVPASIRGMALARLDRMKPFEQLVVKCAAVIGENVSRKMLKSVVPGCNDEKFKKAIYRLMHTRVFECASEPHETNNLLRKGSNQQGRMTHSITCYCYKETDMMPKSEEETSTLCMQLKFHNTLVQETSYKLWLQDQRRSLHESCANYLEGKINEVLITGSTDEVITNQFRLSKAFCNLGPSVNESGGSKIAIDRPGWAANMQKRSTHSTGSKSLSSSSSTTSSRPIIRSSSKQLGTKSSQSIVKHHNIQDKANINHLSIPLNTQRRISQGSVIGRMNTESLGKKKSTCMPLTLKEDVMPKDFIEDNTPESVSKFLSDARKLCLSSNLEDFKVHIDDVRNKTFVAETSTKSAGQRVEAIINHDQRRISYSPLWNESVGFAQEYDRILNSTEDQAKRLSHLKVNSLLHTPYEIHDVLSMLYANVVSHWRKALNTEKTIEYLLKAAESCIAIMSLASALAYLKQADEIVENLDRGLDIVSNFTENDDLNLDDIKVLSVNKNTKARIESLMGQVLFQQGRLDESLAHFLKALTILRSKLPRNRFIIFIYSIVERRRQNLHIKHPSRYIGSASSKLANRYVEQVRCLSYVWQIIPSLKRVSNRLQLSKLVALRQVNRAEAADDDWQELITAYTYMMQLNQFDGDVSSSVYYESKATARCLELPKKLTASDLYITGHLHLVSCSVRLCNGKLALATTAGYRAYNVADDLGDIDIKLLVLPLIAQIHIFTVRGRACNEVLNLLLYISKTSGDEIGIISYYTLCFDLILDAGYCLEKSKKCVEVLQNAESIHMGDVPRFYARSSMAVWCYRRNEVFNGKTWLKLAMQIAPEHFDSFITARAFVRLVEACLLELKKNLEKYGSNDKETVKTNSSCKSLLNKLSKMCKAFAVFQPRYLHFLSLYYMLMGNKLKATENIAKSISMARYCGNKIDQQWAELSQTTWFGTTLSEDYWVANSDILPDWETANKNDHIERSYKFTCVDSIL